MEAIAPERTEERARAPWLIAPVVLAAACLLIGARSLGIGFFTDDHDLLAALARGHRFFDAFPAGRGTYFRPLVMESLRLGGTSAVVQHAINLTLHLSNALLVHALARALRVPPLLALGAALVFACHPANVTDVYWISGRTDLLCAFGYLAGLLAGARFVAGGGAGWAAASAAGAAIALGSKETGVTFAGALALVCILAARTSGTEMRRARSRALTVCGATVAITAIYGAYVSRFYAGGGAPEPRLGVRTLAHALLVYVVPLGDFRLSALLRAHPGAVMAAAATGLLAAGIFAAILLRRARRRGGAEAGFVAAAAALALVPLAPMVAVDDPADRLLYLPLACASVALSAVLARRPDRARTAATVALVAAALFAAGAWARGSAWVRNAALLRTACASFRHLPPALGAGRPLAVLAYPFEAGDAPVFANDLSAVLHHCRHGTFGRLPRVMTVAGVVAASPAGAEPAADDAAGVLRRSLSGDAYFRLPGGWTSLDTPLGRLAAERTGPGRARAVALRVAPAADPPVFVEVRGGRFVLIPFPDGGSRSELPNLPPQRE